MFSLIERIFYLCLIIGISAKSINDEEPRIVGGDVVNITKVPYHVSLRRYGSHYCGGSVISELFVMTAAHCVYLSTPSSNTIVAGTSYLNSNADTYNVKTIHTHEYYSFFTGNDYDIALLEVARRIEFKTTVQPIRLPTSDMNIEDGTGLTVTGWGDTSEGGQLSQDLRRVTVPKVNETVCTKAYESYYVDITPRMICAGISGKDSCQGDSGGALVTNSTDPQIIGIVSFGLGCAREGYPGVYTRVSALRTWVDGVLNGTRY